MKCCECGPRCKLHKNKFYVIGPIEQRFKTKKITCFIFLQFLRNIPFSNFKSFLKPCLIIVRNEPTGALEGTPLFTGYIIYDKYQTKLKKGKNTLAYLSGVSMTKKEMLI
jgi:hypothetical protein